MLYSHSHKLIVDELIDRNLLKFSALSPPEKRWPIASFSKSLSSVENSIKTLEKINFNEGIRVTKQGMNKLVLIY